MALPAGFGASLVVPTTEVRYNGTVKKLIPGTPLRPAHGFIECVETSILFGRDVFLHDQLASSLSVGQPVSFVVGLNSKGMPQAVDVAAECVPQQDLQRAGCTPPALQVSAIPALHTVHVPTAERLCELILPEVSLALQNGMQQSVAAALVATAEALGLAKEMQMHFASTLPSHDISSPAMIRPPQHMDSWDSSGNWWPSSQWRPVRTQQRYEPYAAAANVQALMASHVATPAGPGQFEGTVKSIAAKGASGAAGGDHTYGFVECEETRKIYGRDVFLHSNQASELEVGVRVSFDVSLNQRGMPQAHNLLRLT